VVAHYIASGSNGRVDVIVRLVPLSIKGERRLSRQCRYQKTRRAIPRHSWVRFFLLDTLRALLKTILS